MRLVMHRSGAAFCQMPFLYECALLRFRLAIIPIIRFFWCVLCLSSCFAWSVSSISVSLALCCVRLCPASRTSSCFKGRSMFCRCWQKPPAPISSCPSSSSSSSSNNNSPPAMEDHQVFPRECRRTAALVASMA